MISPFGIDHGEVSKAKDPFKVPFGSKVRMAADKVTGGRTTARSGAKAAKKAGLKPTLFDRKR